MAALIPMVRRIVRARVGQHPGADDLVQETLVRVLAAAGRIEPGMLEPYAIATARNVVTSMWRDNDRQRRNQHRVVDLHPVETPDEQVIAGEEQSAVAQALARLSERETLLAHEVAGQDTQEHGRGDGVNGRCGGRTAQQDTRAPAGGVPARSGTECSSHGPL